MKKRSIAMLLLTCIILSACGQKPVVLDSPSRKVEKQEVSESKELEKVEDFKEPEEDYDPNNEYVGKGSTELLSDPELQGITNDPYSVAKVVAGTGVIQYMGEERELRKFLETHPEHMVPILLLVEQAWDIIYDANGEIVDRKHYPERLKELEEYLENIDWRQKK